MEQQEADQGRAMFRAIQRFMHAVSGIPLGGELSRMEFFTLNVLLHHPDEDAPMCVSELAQALRSPGPGVSRLLGNLERRGLICRTVDRKDRRSTQVALTEEGRQACGRAIETVGDYASQVFQKMGQTEMEQLLTLWDRLSGIMEEVRKNQDEGGSLC